MPFCGERALSDAFDLCVFIVAIQSGRGRGGTFRGSYRLIEVSFVMRLAIVSLSGYLVA